MTYDFERSLRLGRLVREELGSDIDDPKLRTLRTPAGAVHGAAGFVEQMLGGMRVEPPPYQPGAARRVLKE